MRWGPEMVLGSLPHLVTNERWWGFLSSITPQALVYTHSAILRTRAMFEAFLLLSVRAFSELLRKNHVHAALGGRSFARLCQ